MRYLFIFVPFLTFLSAQAGVILECTSYGHSIGSVEVSTATAPGEASRGTLKVISFDEKQETWNVASDVAAFARGRLSVVLAGKDVGFEAVSSGEIPQTAFLYVGKGEQASYLSVRGVTHVLQCARIKR